MTIVARLNTLNDAYAGMEALRAYSIPPDLSKNGDHLIIRVDDDFAEHAKSILESDGRFGKHVCSDMDSSWISFDEHNA